MRKRCLFSRYRAVLPLLTLLLGLLPGAAPGSEAGRLNVSPGAPILFFYSADCADCHAMKRMIDAVLSEDPSLPIRKICIEEEPEAWREACEKAGIPVWGVPRIFIGDTVFAGWSEKDGELIYVPGYYGYMGYRKQVAAAMEAYLGISLRGIRETAAPDSPASGGGCIGGC